ncbi:peptidoglycan binding protein CsiV [Pseudomonas sp. LPB0260]|uniref:CsiV family protein n=1 Tax=Pseudomonas sp. LPB0260 TaxID=2614442 RepID=UPI0015C1EE77|nr:CsiV family protein [Pseudomonas sp. LPB0260]QLC74502.1 peptidoglycan binding protein CsiV [Pseudomonas sp. LPB0260]QLC77272.1 peptidoglycan binding protein CsiV [Pseudomonas sp. LPB0260]
MRAFRTLALLPLTLLMLLATPAVADGLFQVEVIVFRQAGEPVPASQPAPDDWAQGAPSIDLGSERGTALNSEAAKLSAANGYQVLLHKAWSQSLSGSPSRVALSSGGEQFGHFPVEGTLSLRLARFIDVEADLWVNQFDASGLLQGSERLKQDSRLKSGELTYLDHGSLGLLIRVKPL